MKKIIVLLIFISNYAFATETLILDANLKSPHHYQELIQKLQALDQHVEYAHFNTKIDYKKFDAIFLVTSTEFLDSYPNQISKPCLAQLVKFTKLPAKTFIIVLESAPANKIRLFLSRFNIKLDLQILALQKPCYNTALFVSSLCQTENHNKIFNNYITLPRDRSCYQKINSFLPIGCLLKRNQNKILVTTTSKLFFNEINENFRTNPANLQLRMLANKAVTTAFEELFDKKIELESPTFKYTEAKENKHKIIAAWMDLNYWNTQELEQIINALDQCKIDILWIRFNPERYLSKKGIEQEKKEQFFNYIKNFTLALQSTKRPIELYIGCELTSNFKNIKPTQASKDMFGQIYPNIPSLYDFEFWQTELLDPLKELLNTWDQIGNGIAIEGIFLDLEMYHAQNQLSNYNSTTIPQTVNLNIEKLDEQIGLLKNEAFNLGQKLKEELNKIQNNLKIGIYMQTLPANWFYENLIAGISNNDPIILATFNVEFQKHKIYLKKLGINAKHLAVALLSKFTNGIENNLEELINEHDGIWLNRFNRIIEPYQEDKWWSLEATKNPENIANFIQKSKPIS